MKFNLKNRPKHPNIIYDQDYEDWFVGFEKILRRRQKQLEKWKPITDRGQGIRDELLILINDILDEDTRLLCLASLIPREDFGRVKA